MAQVGCELTSLETGLGAQMKWQWFVLFFFVLLFLPVVEGVHSADAPSPVIPMTVEKVPLPPRGFTAEVQAERDKKTHRASPVPSQKIRVLKARPIPVPVPTMTAASEALPVELKQVNPKLAHQKAIKFPNDPSLPVFPKRYTLQEGELLRPVMDAYQKKDYPMAINTLEQFNWTKYANTPLAETATFLLGDLYMKLAETTDKESIKKGLLQKGLKAFQVADAEFPHSRSENALRGILRRGQIYQQLGLYPEAIGNFKRVIDLRPESHYAKHARQGIADAHYQSGEWDEANSLFGRLDLSGFSSAEKKAIFLRQADALYKLAKYQSSYEKYKQADLSLLEVQKKEPMVLFQYADAAFSSKKYDAARRLFAQFNKLYPKDPLGPVVLAMTVETLQLQDKTTEAEQVRNVVPVISFKSWGVRMGRLISAINDVKMTCPGGGAKSKKFECKEEQLRPDLEKIEKLTLGLIGEESYFDRAEERFFDASMVLAEYQAFDTAFQIQTKLLSLLPVDAPLHAKVAEGISDTLSATIALAAHDKDDLQVITLYHKHRPLLLKGQMKGATGMQIGKSLFATGLLSDAIHVYGPISQGGSSFADEATLRLGEAFIQLGRDDEAIFYLSTFKKDHPGSDLQGEAQLLLGEAYLRHGETDKGIEQYKSLIAQNPTHPDKNNVLMKLADVYSQKREYGAAVKIYQQLADDVKSGPKPVIPLADAYYQLADYDRAIASYKAALLEPIDKNDKEWVTLQLANAYRAQGHQMPTERKLYTDVAEMAENQFFKTVAAERVATIPPPPSPTQKKVSKK